MDKQIYINDLQNRFTGHTFSETINNTEVLVKFLDDSSNLVAQARAQSVAVVINAYRKIRKQVLEGGDPPAFISTTAQRDTLVTISPGTIIDNITLGWMEIYRNNTWINAAGIGTSKPVAYGEMFENNSSGSEIDSTSKKWITAQVGLLDGNSLWSFSNNAAGDRLVAANGSAGRYELHLKTNFTNDGGNLTTLTIYQNDVAQTKFVDEHDGDSSERRNLAAQGLIDIADTDYLNVHIVSSSPSDLITVFDINLYLHRID